MASSDSIHAAFEALALDAGIMLHYVDDRGALVTAEHEIIAAVLESLGIDPDRSRASTTLRERRLDRQRCLVAPVVVLDADRPAALSVRLDARSTGLDCVLTTEGDGVIELRVGIEDLSEEAGGRRRLTLPMALPSGYHRLELSDGTTSASTAVLVRPGHRSLQPSGNWRGLGLVAPLFSLRSASSFGAGDLGALNQLADAVSESGVGVVATLPLLAGFTGQHFEPSPYLPVSRRFWHERWIDLDEAWTLCAPEIPRDLTPQRFSDPSADDVHRTILAKRAVIERLARIVTEQGAYVASSFEEFCARRPEVLEYARFRAAGERHGIDWTRWAGAARSGSISPSFVDPEATRFHAFAQWLSTNQLTALSADLEARGQVLGLDLPLGVHPLGYDIFSAQEQFAKGLSVGAPPDTSFPHGQRWGFPPIRPEAARLDGHGIFRGSLAHHLSVAATLRIDHALGLQRLFVIPDGADVAEGVYLSSPTDELLAVIAIESQRHGADVVGEDLGTVGPLLPQLLEREGIRRTYVAELNITHEGGDVLRSPPVGSVALFSTHDLPPFAGWWTMRDVDERVALGLLDDEDASLLVKERSHERSRLIELAGGIDQGDLLAAPSSVLDAAHASMAASDAGLVMLQLQDLLGEDEAVNLPGTSTERPNWIQLSSRSIEEIADDADLQARIGALHQLRSARRSPSISSASRVVGGITTMDPFDDHLFNEGQHFRLYEKLGAHQMTVGGQEGTYFAVWAPNAARVEVIGDFNAWSGASCALFPHKETGVFEGFIAGVGLGERYKFRITSDRSGAVVDKADPMALQAEVAPRTASITAELNITWGDQAWMAARGVHGDLDRPIAVYEVHLGSWRRVPEEGARMLTYREAAPLLIDHVKTHGFTHVELLPIAEHPLYASWGYQPTGFFAPTSRYGTPEDFAWLVDQLHQAGIGVLLDWVPAHFPSDDFALALFDGTHLYEHADERQRIHPDWGSLIFNYGRNEVRSFLISSACSFLDRFHIDGLRFDAVASMLYLDYSRAPGSWIPNRFGGRENLEAIEFLRRCNDEIHTSFPGVITVAEESTAWPGVTAPTIEDGLGFDYKWDLGWMHDTLSYLRREPVHRSFHLDELTFRSMYHATEHYMLPLSHDEVVHGKGSLLNQMAGDPWQRFANLRLLFGLQYAQPGKKLLFMGGEFAQEIEWAHDHSLDWHVLDRPSHAGILALITELNALYRRHGALHRDDLDGEGFSIIDADASQSVLCIERYDRSGDRVVACFNGTPVPRPGYRVGMPSAGPWSVILNSDDSRFGGSSSQIEHEVTAVPAALHGREWSAALDLPPLGFVLLSPSR